MPFSSTLAPLAAADRVYALESYDILDTPPEPEFDDIVFLASSFCETPVALISLVDKDRQWFKASVGFEVCETPIEQSVCAHALAKPDLLIIPDLTADPRTRNNRLVVNDPKIRFYAGAPLVTAQGVIIGTLCVIDQKPRPGGLTPTQEKALEALSRQVMILLDARRDALRRDELYRRQRNISASLRALARSNAAAQEAGKIGTFELDIDTDQLAVSAEFCRIFGVPVAPVYPAATFEAMVVEEDRIVSSNAQTRDDGSSATSVEYRIRRPDGEIRWIARDATFADDGDRPSRMFGSVQDITEIKQDEADQAVLNKELSHRLKNMFSMVQALASQTLRPVAEKHYVRAFEERLRALSTAHDILLRKSSSGAGVEEIVSATMGAIAVEDRVDATGPNIELGPKAALSMSLLLHELATNAIKYGSLARPKGRVVIEWELADGGETFRLQWREVGGAPVTPPEETGFGSKLISMGLGTGKTQANYHPEGFSFETAAPLESLRQPN